MKTSVIIQARMNSTRLPGKVLLPFNGNPVLWWIAARVMYSGEVNEVIIATTRDKTNDPIANNRYLPFGCKVFRYGGEEDDVIGRVLTAAKWSKTDIIIDITGDCPLVDPKHIDYLARYVKEFNYDYASNCIKRTWPDGLDVQIYKTEALQRCINKFNPKQHCGWNVAQHPEVFNLYNWEAPESMYWPELGLTLDTVQDYELLKIIFNKFGKNIDFKVEDIVLFLKQYPDLLKINKDVRRKTPEEG